MPPLNLCWAFWGCKDIKVAVEIEEILVALIINWDQTDINYVPVSSWTMAKEGLKRVEIVGIDDKHQITSVYGCSISTHPTYLSRKDIKMPSKFSIPIWLAYHIQPQPLVKWKYNDWLYKINTTSLHQTNQKELEIMHWLYMINLKASVHLA